MHETHTEVTADDRRAQVREPERRALTVRTERSADVLVLWLSGTLDEATSPLLDREFDAQAGHATHVVLDLTGVNSIDSHGRETLVRTHRHAAENGKRRPSGKDPMRDGSRWSSPTTPTWPSQPAARRANVSTDETFFAHATECVDVDHQRPL